ncbi:unnamed protein product [Hyaloperonospora brassicae]|uniref:RxLR effector protein n=1 Tax=Hyaloperonospora brassicae TaxID=162125 RepID=A0AAV0UX17_HYABA|nr:unnamed protein product [Hyaloperonospora brassicae]
MRPSLLVSAAVLCLATYDSAVAAAPTSNNLLKSGETSSVLADHDAVAADTNPKHQRLLRHLEAEDPEIPASEPAVMASNGSPSGNENTEINTSDDNFITFDISDSSDSSDSSSSSETSKPSRKFRIPKNKDVFLDQLAVGMSKSDYDDNYGTWMREDEITRAEAEAKIDELGSHPMTAHFLKAINQKAYIAYLKRNCRLPENSGRPACVDVDVSA